jgi:hypothetical protein
MCKITFCPLLILSSPNLPITRFSEKLLEFASKCIDQCTENKIEIHLAREVWNQIFLSFPWGTAGTDEIKQYVAFWRSAIIGPLNKKIKFHDIEQNKSSCNFSEVICETSKNKELNHEWINWLNYWSDGKLINNKIVKGLATNRECCQNENRSSLCEKFIPVLGKIDLKIVCHPWYLIYPLSLPSTGEYCFVPPIGWEKLQSRKGKNYGYLDNDNNEWVWDLGHDDHWDVQLNKRNKYIRISADGKEIDK